jgi:tetratricopeptide (TPR) repeat protein
VKKSTLFYIVALALPVAFFGLLEGGLRLVGYGGSYPLFLRLESHPHLLYPNPEVARRYFTRQESLPGIPFDTFTERKDERALRVFIQGGSTAAGFPYYFGASLSDLLEDRLQRSFPEREVEVVATAMAAVNSFTLLDLADEIIEHEPDLVLVYAGHNEYYGALGTASTESLTGSVGMVRTYLAVSKLRLVQLMRSALSAAAGLLASRRRGEAPGATLMAKMVGEQSIPYGSDTYDRGMRQFEANLGALLSKYRDAGVPVVVGTLASNVRGQRPFVFDPDDPDNASVHFERARRLEAEGDTVAARTAYLAAKDRDELRFRAPESFNEIIRAVAAVHGAAVAEVLDALESASESGIVGDDLMTEHLHPNPRGYFALADAFYATLIRQVDWVEEAGSPPVVVDGKDAWTAMVFSELDSLLGDYRLQLLKASWPFAPAGSSTRRPTFETRTEIEKIAGRVYSGDLSRVGGLEQMRQIQLNEGRPEAAVESGRAILQRYSFLPEPHLAVGDLLVAAGRPEEAFSYYERANQLRESQTANRMMGSILLNAGQRDEAIPYLERAVIMDPDDVQALYNLAGAYALTGQMGTARNTVGRLLELDPDHTAGLKLLESLPPGP